MNSTRLKTAFKHPDCGGVILIVDEGDLIIYECSNCQGRSLHLVELAVGLVITPENASVVTDEQVTHES